MSIEVYGFRGALANIIAKHDSSADFYNLDDIADDVCALFDHIINYISEELNLSPENFVCVDSRDLTSEDIAFGLYKLKRLSGEEETMCLQIGHGAMESVKKVDLHVLPTYNKKYIYNCRVGYMTHTINLNDKERVIYELANGNIDVSKNLVRYES